MIEHLLRRLLPMVAVRRPGAEIDGAALRDSRSRRR
jgi:hypothetical protein